MLKQPTIFTFWDQGFEDNIRKNRAVMINWIKYAAWEESQNEVQRWVP